MGAAYLLPLASSNCLCSQSLVPHLPGEAIFMFHSIPPAAAKAVMLPALAVIFGEKQHERMRAACHPRSGAQPVSLLPWAASSAFPAPCSRPVVSGSIICGRNPEVPPTTSSHEPPSAAAGAKGGFHEPSWALLPRFGRLRASALGTSNSPHPPCPFSMASEGGELKSVRPGAGDGPAGVLVGVDRAGAVTDNSD